ncbi:MAG: hypothetical protein ACD_58C00200G0008 [uncultured bacterium]|nr:MAG: hypothetical protein ACD_58C00200G0008 [uncultured bacterium]
MVCDIIKLNKLFYREFMNIYIDESGDLGSAKKSGKYFIIAIVSINNPKQIETWMRRIRSRKLNKKDRKASEAKAVSASHEFKKYFYEHLINLDFKISFVVIKKSKITTRLKKEQGLIYLYMIKKGVANTLTKNNNPILITIDRRHFQKLTKESFNIGLKEFLMINCGSNNSIKIHHIDSSTNNLLQFVDFIVYAAGRKYNIDDLKWYNYLKKNIYKEKIIELSNNK